MKTTENTTVTIMTEKAMNEKINEIIEKLNELKKDIGDFVPVVRDENYEEWSEACGYLELATEWIDDTIKEFDNNLDYAEDNLAGALGFLIWCMEKLEDRDCPTDTLETLLKKTGDVHKELTDLNEKKWKIQTTESPQYSATSS
jgi:enoyl reductase-like protein